MAERKNVIPAGGTDKARVQVRGDRGASFLIALAFMLIVTMVVAVALSAAVTNAERIGQHSDDEQAYFSVASASDLVSGLIEGSGANTVGTLALKNPTSGDELSVFGYEEGADKTGLSEWVVTTARKVYASKSGNASESSGRVSPQSDDDAEDDGYRQTWTVDTNLGEASNANALPVDVTLSMGDDYSITVTAQVADAEATDYSNAIKKTFRAHSVENGGFAWGEGTEIVETLYTVTFVSEGGEELSSVQYHYGTEAEDIVRPAAPEKEATAEYTYTFSGWSPEIADVTGDATYTATYTATKRKYDVTWKDEDGTKLATNQVEYGSTPSYGGDTPTKTSTAQYEYTFAGWSPKVTAVAGEATYTATFTETLRTYTVTWKNADGSILETDANVSYGATPTYNGDTPTRASTSQYDYTFIGWAPTISAVTGDVSYVASYDGTLRSYMVTWKNEDGSVLETDTNVLYGTTPTYDGATPIKASTAQNVYTFTGWSPEIVAVTGDTVYTAVYESSEYENMPDPGTTATKSEKEATNVFRARTQLGEWLFSEAEEKLWRTRNPTWKEVDEQPGLLILQDAEGYVIMVWYKGQYYAPQLTASVTSGWSTITSGSCVGMKPKSGAWNWESAPPPISGTYSIISRVLLSTDVVAAETTSLKWEPVEVG